MFGPHLIIDGSRCDTKKLADRVLVEQVLNDYPRAIGMTKIGGPYMFEYQAPDPAYSGVSGLVVIAESHIAIHTFPELDYFTMDIFSCKNFDHEKAIEYIKSAFDVQEMDRMLVQRGLSFRGPHHGRNGATDELIAAADKRLAAGVISKEPALPDEGPSPAEQARLDALSERLGNGRMVWPAYGVTPDYGTYGERGDETGDTYASSGGRMVAMNAGAAPVSADGRALPASEPAQINPTASISGLLDKLTAIGGQGRALGRSVAIWERLARDNDATIALTLAEPALAGGLRETLIYAVERRYVNVIVASADDLFADLYEALGAAHYIGEDGEPVATDEGTERTRAFLAGFLDELAPSARAGVRSGADLWRLLGEALPARAPRKGLLQAAAAMGVAIFTPDLGSSALGGVLLAARARGAGVALDPANDTLALARLLGRRPRLGVIRAGEGAQASLLTQAREAAAMVGAAPATLVGSVTLGAGRALAQGESHAALATDATLALPLLTTALAQRVPYTRAALIFGLANDDETPAEPTREQEPALA